MVYLQNLDILEEIGSHWDIILVAIFFLLALFHFQMLSTGTGSKKKNSLVLGVWILFFVVTWVSVEVVEVYVQKKEREKLLGYAPSYAWLFEQMDHSKLNFNTAANDPLYMKLIDYEKAWLKGNPFISDIYTMRRNTNGEIAFLVDSETDYNNDGVYQGDREGRTSIGEVFPKQIPALEEAFAGTPSFTLQPYTDRWGTWISAFVPIHHNGQVDAVLAIDFSAESYLREVRTACELTLLCSFLFFSSVFGSLYTKFSHDKHHSKLSEALKHAEQATKVKSQFLANMSHEIRTPLNGIMGMINLIADEPLDIKVREKIEIVKRSADSLRSLVNDILDFSKIESGKMEIETIRFDVSQAVYETLEVVSLTAQRKGLSLVCDIKELPCPWVQTDLNRFRQVVLNLVSNAIKFTTEGFVRVEVFQKSFDGDRVDLSVRVSDSGVGIPEDVQEKLFQQFTQADASLTRRFGGTGLGLAICKGIVEGLGGQISMQSEVGKGSSFSFSIPVLKAEERPVDRQKPLELRPLVAEKKPLSILVADDHPTNLILTLAYLKKLGYHADSVANGLEVLKELDRKKYDLIFMDCQMPEMDGLTATQKIRQRSGKPDSPWIVALTASALKEDQDRCFSAGMNDFVSKPFDLQALSSAIFRIRPTEATTPSFDFSKMKKHFGPDVDIMYSMIDNYLKGAEASLLDLEQALQNKDSETLRILSHKMRGVLGNFYVVDLQTHLLSIETCAKTKRLEEAQKLFPDLKQKILSLNQELQDLYTRKAG